MVNDKIKGVLRRSVIVLVFAVVLIQFIRPERNANTEITADDVTRLYPVPDSVLQLLHTACYDCHSNNTHYPWYYNIQPVAWWMDDHIHDGKRELNFSEFGKRKLAKQAKKMRKVAKEINEGEMPLDSYLWIHKDAALSEGQKQMLVSWADSLSAKIAQDTLAAKP